MIRLIAAAFLVAVAMVTPDVWRPLVVIEEGRWPVRFAPAAPVYAAEQLNLTTPVTAPSVTSWTPKHWTFDYENQRIAVLFRGPAGEAKHCTEVGAAATSTMNALAKARLDLISLPKRTITWAQGLTPPCLGAGSVSGSPD